MGDLLQQLQHKTVVQIKRLNKIQNPDPADNHQEWPQTNELYRVREVRGLLTDILDAQLEKVRLEQQIRQVKLQQQKQSLCRRLSGLKLKKNLPTPTTLQTWKTEFDTQKREGAISIEMKEESEDCIVILGGAIYSQNESAHKESDRETLELLLDCNNCLFNINIEKLSEAEQDAGGTESSGRTGGVVHVSCDIYIEGLEECIMGHLHAGSSIHKMLNDIVILFFDKYLTEVKGY